MRATGHITLSGADVYLRFEATDEAVTRLTRGYRRLDAREARETVDSLVTHANEYWLKDQPSLPNRHQVHWEDLGRIERPEVYHKSPMSGNDNYLVVDPARGLVYFYHFNI